MPGVVIFGKNSDRPQGEGQSIQRYPAQVYNEQKQQHLQQQECTYICIPQAARTYAVLLSQIDWMWGAEHGANECGVVIGNEAVWTKVKDESLATKRLLGMDLVRLGLERGSTAREALDVITKLLETHGQGGPCAQDDDDSFTYHNSFLIVDVTEAWVLETAGRHWVALRTVTNRNISNTLTIRDDYDLSSKGLEEYAKKNGLWDGTGSLDWARVFGEGAVQEIETPDSRLSCGCRLLHEMFSESNTSSLDHGVAAMKQILRNHDGGGICMHGYFETAASMISELVRSGDNDDDNDTTTAARHWMLNRPHPCEHDYTEQPVILTTCGH